jgi:hypothetical protein
MTESVEHASLAAAFVAAQAEMPAVEADAENPHFRSKFVSLGNLVAKARPVLNRHGIGVAQFPSIDEHGKPTLVTVLMHGKSGEQMAYPAPLLLPKADPQGQGSAITYMRRYALAAALGIVDQEDDDGTAAARPAEPSVDADRANAIGTLISAALAAGMDGPALAQAFADAGATPAKIDRHAVAALTESQATIVERTLQAVIANNVEATPA